MAETSCAAVDLAFSVVPNLQIPVQLGRVYVKILFACGKFLLTDELANSPIILPHFDLAIDKIAVSRQRRTLESTLRKNNLFPH